MLQIGNILDIPIVKKMPYGFFVDVLDGVSALIIDSANADFSIGEKVKVEIKDIDHEIKRVLVTIAS